MKRVNSFNIEKRKRDALLAFFKAVITAGQGDEKVTALCKTQFAALVVAYNVMQNLAERHQMNLLTEDVQNADTWRDATLSRFRAAVRAELKNPDPQKKQAAELLWKICQEMGRIHNQGFDQQTGAMTTFCLDLEKNHSGEMTLLGLTDDFQAMKGANEAFIELLAERTTTEGEYVKGSPQAARQTAITAYRNFVMKLNTLITEGHYAELAEFIDYLNALIDRQRVALKQGTRNPSEEPDPDPDIWPENPEGGETPPEEKPDEKPGQKPEDGEQVPTEGEQKPTEGEQKPTEGEQKPEEGDNNENNPGDNTGGSSSKKLVTYKYPETGEVITTQEYEVGEKIVPPTPPTGYVWGYYPDNMPDRNVFVDALPDVIDF